MERFEKETPPTRMCLWYKGGDVAREPYLAFVIESTSQEAILELAVLKKGMIAFNLAHGVRHRDDPFLATRSNHVKENGFWDYLPGMEPTPPELAGNGDLGPTEPDPPLPTADIREATDSPGNRARVKALMGEGKNSPEIATTMCEETGEHWTHQRVGAMVRQFASE